MLKAKLKSERLRDVLLKKNLSQNWLAKRLKISSGYMSQMLSGVRCPSPLMRQRIMDSLPDMAFEDLFEVSK